MIPLYAPDHTDTHVHFDLNFAERLWVVSRILSIGSETQLGSRDKTFIVSDHGRTIVKAHQASLKGRLIQ